MTIRLRAVVCRCEGDSGDLAREEILMWSRRTFIAASCSLATWRVTETVAFDLREVAVELLFEAVKLGLQDLDRLLDAYFRVETDVKKLISVRARVEDVRRKLTDSTPEHHLQVRLAEWLKRYNSWISEKPMSGESDADFAARHERGRVFLQDDWKVCTTDAVSALREIRYIGDELQSIPSTEMPLEEWHKYTRLLDDEKMTIEVINSDMPTDPRVINRLREVAAKLEQGVNEIDKRIVEANYLIAKYGP